MGHMGHGGPQAPQPQPLPGVAHVVAVGSGKGGVGKTTVAVLAEALAPISIWARSMERVNFRAFERRFIMTCQSITESPITSGNSPTTHWTSRPSVWRRNS